MLLAFAVSSVQADSGTHFALLRSSDTVAYSLSSMMMDEHETQSLAPGNPASLWERYVSGAHLPREGRATWRGWDGTGASAGADVAASVARHGGGRSAAPHREQGHPGGNTREAQRRHRCTCLGMRGPPTDPLFAACHGLATTRCSSEVLHMTADERHGARGRQEV